MNRSSIFLRGRYYRQPVSSVWVAAAGSCVVFHLCENTSRDSNIDSNDSILKPTTTFAERHPGNDSKEQQQQPQQQPQRDTTSSSSNNNIDQVPWYRRYPSQGLERLRSAPLRRRGEDDQYLRNNNHNMSMRLSKDNDSLFYGQCLQRQLWKPKIPYPAWDYNWDGKQLEGWSTLEALSTTEGLQQSGCTGTTRHIILVRHGQYDEEPYDDRKRILTALGRRQAFLTGKRMGQWIQQIGMEKFKNIYTSDIVRAKQTAWIMAKSMPDSIPIRNPDPDLNEALPAPMIPARPDIPDAIEEIDEQMVRMDRAFRKYFYRADPPLQLLKVLEQLKQEHPAKQQQQEQQQSPSSSEQAQKATSDPGGNNKHGASEGTSTRQSGLPSTQIPSSASLLLPQSMASSLPRPNHEFDIIVCHGNIIRYFVCRALQVPPEAWLRQSVFNCSITYIMIKPNGYVSCRMIGDIGHIGYKEYSFSGAHGLVWS